MEDTVTPGAGLKKRFPQGSKRSKSHHKKMERLSDEGVIGGHHKKKKEKEKAAPTGYFSGFFSVFGYGGNTERPEDDSTGSRPRNIRSKSQNPRRRQKK